MLCLLVCTIPHLNAQERAQRAKGFHKHDGFYLSMSLGPLFGPVKNRVTNTDGSTYTIDLTGTGSSMDYKIGWAVKENLIVHATVISNLVIAPTQETMLNGQSITEHASDEVDLGEVLLGVGTTYYLMPANVLVSGSAGMGKFTLSGTGNDMVSDPGLSLQLKVGKEWWVSKNWGIGLGLTYGMTKVDHQSSGGMQEKLNSNRFGILLNTTFN